MHPQPGPLHWEMPGEQQGTHIEPDPHPCDVLDSEETGHDVFIRRSRNILHLHGAVLLEPRLGPVLQTGLWREEQLSTTRDRHWDMGKGDHAPPATLSGMEGLALDNKRSCWHKGRPQNGTQDPGCCYTGPTAHCWMEDPSVYSL